MVDRVKLRDDRVREGAAWPEPDWLARVPGTHARDVRARLQQAWLELTARQRQSGWFELHYVKQYGPYLYYRWHEDGRRRSKYCGKAYAAPAARRPAEQ